MTKRLFDLAFSLIALVAVLPILAIAALLIWMQDGGPPLYRGVRVGRRDRDFRMIKLRTMIAGGERLGGSSTAASDRRLTPLGAALRRFKLDELPQFWNVIVGDMSVVGPRPNVRHGGVDRYTDAERRLLSVRPGITDLASIVFSDEGEILEGSDDAETMYDRVIRPWKNRLGLLYVARRGMIADLYIVALTALALVSRRAALRGVAAILAAWDVDPQLQRICLRQEVLPAGEPPGRAAAVSP